MPKTSKSPDATDLAVGHKIRAQRLINGISQAELAERLDLTSQQLQKYEKGANRVSAGRLKLIAEALEIPVSAFFEGAPDSPTTLDDANVESRFLAMAASARLARAFVTIKDPHVRREIVALVETLAAHQPVRHKPHHSRRKSGR